MMYKMFSKIVKDLNHNSLIYLRAEIQRGAPDLTKMIEEQIEKHESISDAKICGACGHSYKTTDNDYILIFGPHDFRKKASFCGSDCMEHFFRRLEEVTQQRLKEGQV